ncbi:MAG: SigE family RNA polymerase sigma factor [Bacteroidales bacterium]
MSPKEYNSCVDQYADSVYRFILRNTGDEDTARDIVQEAFARLWEKAKGIDFSKSRSYLFTTAYHAMIDHFRRNRRYSDQEPVESDQVAVAEPNPDLQEILQQALAKLPAVQRSVVMLRDWEGYNYQEIGEITGLNESQVKVYIYRARQFLKKYLVDIEYVL